ncbi:unnamed protein product, partial [Arabidopsis halleri]
STCRGATLLVQARDRLPTSATLLDLTPFGHCHALSDGIT